MVIGGGFGGISAIQALRHRHPEIRWFWSNHTALSFNRCCTNSSVVSSTLGSGAGLPWAHRSLGVSWLQDSVIGINIVTRTLTLASGGTLSWGQLLVTAGSERNDFGTPGVQQHALSFRDDGDVQVLRQRIALLHQQRSKDAALVIVGAGATGVELACKLADLLDGAAALHLIEMGPTILPNSSAFNRERATVACLRYLGTAVTAVHPDRVVLGQAPAISHQGLIWTAGSRPVSIPMTPSPAQDRGRLRIGPTLNLEGDRDVFAIGDISHAPDQRWPATAQVAMQQGAAVADAMASQRRGESPQPFQFTDRGEMLSLGIGDACLTGLGLTLAGPLAFQIRRAYLTRMPGPPLTPSAEPGC